MTTKADLTFRNGENWRILFVAHEEDGSIMPLTSAAVKFRLQAVNGVTYAIEKTVGDGIVITNAAAGAARIDVSTYDQQLAGVTPETAYTYEILVIESADTSIQAEGRLIVAGSLFGPEVNALLRVFRFRFPEITDDDAMVMSYIVEAQNTIIQDGGWHILDIEMGTIYLAAHFLTLRKTSSQQYIGGGYESSAVRTISIENRSVSFGGRMTAPRVGYSETGYGRHFQMLSNRQVRFVMRA